MRVWLCLLIIVGVIALFVTGCGSEVTTGADGEHIWGLGPGQSETDHTTFLGVCNGKYFDDGVLVDDIDPDGNGETVDSYEAIGSRTLGRFVYFVNAKGNVTGYSIPRDVDVNISWRGCTFESTKREIRRAYKDAVVEEDADGNLDIIDRQSASALSFVFEKVDGKEVLTNVYTFSVLF